MSAAKAPAAAARSPRATGFRAVGVLAAGLAIYVTMRANGSESVTAGSMAVVLTTIGFWALAILPEALTSLLFLLTSVVVVGLAPAVVFSGFTGSAFWLIFAGALLGTAATRTGLSRRIAGFVVSQRFQRLGYGGRITVIVAFSTALALILPSTLARVSIMLPIVLALCDRVGYEAGGRARTGMVLAAAIGCYMVPTSFLPANLPTVILSGSLEQIYGILPTWGRYFLIQFPVVGLIKGAGLVLLLTVLFRAPPSPERTTTEADGAPMSPAARRLAVVMAATLLLWTLDFLHGISPAWIALGAAIVCLMPFSGILSLKEMPSDSMFPTLLYIGGVLGIGGVMAQSGAGAALAMWIVDHLPLAAVGDIGRLALITLGAMVTTLATTTPVAPAISAPLFGQIADVTGWSVEAVGMAQVLAYATPLMPYQLPPLMWAVAVSGLAMGTVTRVLLILAAVTAPLSLLAAHLWWQILGLY